MTSSRSVRERISRLQVSHISDAMGRGGVPEGVRPVVPGLCLLGPAFTVRAHPADNLALHRALLHAEDGQVLAVDGGGLTSVALWGELMSVDALERRLAGLVVDGAVRDAASFAAFRFPVYARTITPRGPTKSHPGELGLPVNIGGVAVSTGDLIYGDGEGVVVIPAERVLSVLDQAEAIARREEDLKDQVRRGKRLFDLLGLKE